MPHLFLEIREKNKINAKLITLKNIAVKIFKKIKERKSTPKTKPKQEI